MSERLLSALKLSLASTDSALNLRNLKYLPRWAVFLIDIFLVSISIEVFSGLFGSIIFMSGSYHKTKGLAAGNL